VFEKLKELIENYENQLDELHKTDINELVEQEIERLKPSIHESITQKVTYEMSMVEAKISAVQEAYEVVIHSVVEQETTPVVEPVVDNADVTITL
jgi:oligoendopeptidase F